MVRRGIAVLVVLFLLAVILVKQIEAPPSREQSCSQTPAIGYTVKGTAKLGGFLNRYLHGDGYSHEEIRARMDKAAKLLGLHWWILKASSDGGEQAGLDFAAAAKLDTAPVGCLPPPDCQEIAPPTPETAEPYDPKVAKLSGPALAADALRKAAPDDSKWLAEIPLGVAIADGESTFNPTASNDVNTGHVGLWQISGANAAALKLGDRNDPYVNARYAYALWKGRGGTWSKDWTVYETALRNQDKYARFGTGFGGGAVAIAEAPAPVQPDKDLKQEPETFTPDGPVDCQPAELAGRGGMGVTVGTWNVLYRNSKSNVEANAPFADLVGLQEIRDKHRPLNIRGYQATKGGAVPIIWRTSKLEPVPTKDLPNGWKREEVLTGSVHKNVTYGLWRNMATGEIFGAVNTHQYVNGGVKWAEQARKVERVRKRLARTGVPVVLLGDFNAPESKVEQFFGASGTGRRIDRVVAYGTKAAKTESLDRAGSDHYRVRVYFPSKAKAAAPGSPPPTKAVGSGRAGARKAALKLGASYASYHPDPAGKPSMDMGVSGAKGDRLARHLIDNRATYDIEYVIWNKRIYSAHRGWATGSPYYRPAKNDHEHKWHVHATFLRG